MILTVIVRPKQLSSYSPKCKREYLPATIQELNFEGVVSGRPANGSTGSTQGLKNVRMPPRMARTNHARSYLLSMSLYATMFSIHVLQKSAELLGGKQ